MSNEQVSHILLEQRLTKFLSTSKENADLFVAFFEDYFEQESKNMDTIVKYQLSFLLSCLKNYDYYKCIIQEMVHSVIVGSKFDKNVFQQLDYFVTLQQMVKSL
jgi:hypothetical protein